MLGMDKRDYGTKKKRRRWKHYNKLMFHVYWIGNKTGVTFDIATVIYVYKIRTLNNTYCIWFEPKWFGCQQPCCVCVCARARFPRISDCNESSKFPQNVRQYVSLLCYQRHHTYISYSKNIPISCTFRAYIFAYTEDFWGFLLINLVHTHTLFHSLVLFLIIMCF